MFTGIVEEMGTVVAVDETDTGRRLTFTAGKVLDGMEVGDSIAVNGVCLTAVAVLGDSIAVEAVGETLARTNLGDLTAGGSVDLERPLRADGRFDGHIVQGHVDGVGVVAEVSAEGDARRMRIAAEAALLKYIVEKGSITVDGVSLTVTAVDGETFEVVLIPHTLDVTVLGRSVPGSRLNLEVDVLAKYVERLVGGTS